jgi:hypothetical protein
MRASDVLKMNLTEDELRRWHINIDEATNKRYCSPNHKALLLTYVSLGLCDIINASFIWENTPEGYTYWGKIAHRTELIKVRCLRKVIL